MTLTTSWLVQRLEKPFIREGESIFAGKDNPFAFGGGYKNGGLSDEAMALTRDLWRYDYMGAAEFEFGEVPKTLGRIASMKPRNMKAFYFDILLSKVPEPWVSKGTPPPARPPKGAKGRVYAFCTTEDADEVTERIYRWATENYNGDLKESTYLSQAMRPTPGDAYTRTTCGWLELDNGFMFFTDQTMWYGACHLFGIKGASLPEVEVAQ